MQRDTPMIPIKKRVSSRKRNRVLAAVLCAAAVCLCLSLEFWGLTSSSPVPKLGASCVELVHTRGITLDGPLLQVLPCDHVIKGKIGGYCVCGGSMAVPAVPAFMTKATCSNLCANSAREQAIPIPSSSSCPPGTPDFFQWPLATPAPQLPNDSSIATSLDWWLQVGGTLSLTDQVALPPGPRNKTHDFVSKGFRMAPSHIAHAQQQWRNFSAAAEAVGSPVESFTGRGVAILSGATPYLVPSLIALKALRRTGCTLPVEMWLPEAEAPEPEIRLGLQHDLEQLGAKLILLPVPPVLAGQAGYYLKAVVLAVSTFREVLFLDADNVPVVDPTTLFDSQEFQRTGALFWRDFWDASWAPDAPAVLGVGREQLPSFTIDSGQMLLDKASVGQKKLYLSTHTRQQYVWLLSEHFPQSSILSGAFENLLLATPRSKPEVETFFPVGSPNFESPTRGQGYLDRTLCMVRNRMWIPIVSALFFNIHGYLFYPLFTNFMGLGDKETFHFAMISHGVPYSVATHRTHSVGILEPACGLFACVDKLHTNTIAQKDPHGRLMFLHTNMKPKWTMAVPENFETVVRRWRVLSPGQDSLYDDFVALMDKDFGDDLEQEMHSFLIQARCNDRLRNLTAAQEAASPGTRWHIAQLANERLPSKPWDTQLTQTFEDPGLTGDFLIDYPPTWLQHLKHYWNKPRFGKASRWNGTTSELVARSDVSLWRDHW